MTLMKWAVLATSGLGALVTSPAMAQLDPGAAGPYTTTSADYGSWTRSISLGGIGTIEVLGRVNYPTDLTHGPYPLVVMLHGRHATCYYTSGSGSAYVWPCPSGMAPIPSYLGYEYAARVLASHGMIVVSISADGINAADNSVSGYGMAERAQLIQYHLDQWRTFNSTGASPFGSTFVGKVDLTRVGTMGHSRGGEGVIWNYERNQALGAPYGIRAVLPIAPVDFFRHSINNVAVGVLLGYCDGDVYELHGVGYFDDARYAVQGDNSPKYTFLALGANHNFFNTIWTPDQYAHGSSDDWGYGGTYCNASAAGNSRLTSAQQRGVGLAYMSAFFRKHLLGAISFDGILNGDEPPPPSAMNSAVYNGYFPGQDARLDLNRLTDASSLTVNTLGGSVATSGLAEYSQCGSPTSVTCTSSVSWREPHFSYSSLRSLELGWTSLGGAWYSNQLPYGQRDISHYSTLQFRVAVDFSDSRNAAEQEQDFSVQLVDGSGRMATARASDYLAVLYYPPAEMSHKAAVMNTARIPIGAFAGVDVNDIASVDLIFDQKPSGGLLISDIAFSDKGMTAAENWLLSAGWAWLST